MAQTFKIIGKLTKEDMMAAAKPLRPCKKPDDLKSRNLTMNELLKVEKERYQAQKVLVNEWSKIHSRYATDIKLMRDSVEELHRYIVGRLQELPLDIVDQAHTTNDIDKMVDKYNDTIEDKMYNLESAELEESRNELLARRKKRDEDRTTVLTKRVESAVKQKQKLEEALRKEELAREMERENEALVNEVKGLEAERISKAQKEYKQQQKAEAAQTQVVVHNEEAKQKQEALDTSITDTEMILNVNGINSNLLSFSSRLADIIRGKKMTRATLAKTKSGSLVIVCSKPSPSEQENVRISFRNGRYSCSIASNTFCRYIRQMYECNETDEHRFNIKYVAYADDIKIKIEGRVL